MDPEEPHEFQPEQPGEPVDPQEPVDPLDPSDPLDPADLVDPSDTDDDDDDEPYGLDDDDDDDEGHPEPEVTIEIGGLSLYTHFGVTAAERELGQRLLIDLRLDVGECDATVTDRVQDTVDYGEVCEVVNLVAQGREYRTLERFCAAVADRLIERYELHAVWVKAAKPEPPIALPVGEVAVEIWREA
jgi:dihydroneopterin aldolase